MEDLEQKKNTKFKDWATFLGYTVLAVISFYYGIWWGGLMFGVIAVYSFPSTKLKPWLHKKGQEGLELVKGLLWLGLGLLIIAGVIWLVSSVFNGIGGLGKYEGQSAKEWFNQYDEASAQVEELKTALQEANDNIEEVNGNIESAKLYEGSSYDDMVDALNSLDTVSTVDEP